MEILIILIVLAFLGCALIGLITTLVWFGRLFTGRPRTEADTGSTPSLPVKENKSVRCPQCNRTFNEHELSCSVCGWQKPSTVTAAVLRELAETARGVERLRRFERIDAATYSSVHEAVADERARQLRAPREKADAPPDSSPAINPNAISSAASPLIVPTLSPSVPSLNAEAVPQSQPAEAVTPLTTATASSTLFQSTPGVQPVANPAKSRRSLAEVFASFMEERNIRWGELVGGLLIIGCSIALVVSFWASITEIPTLKFFLFTIVTAALFGIGLYTEHRWKLPTTSRGVLLISTLLVPLNFLAIAAASDSSAAARQAGTSTSVLLSQLLAPIIFLPLVYYAGRTLTPHTPHLLAIGVLGSSLVQLVVRALAGSNITATQLLMLGALPVVCYGATLAPLLIVHTRRLRQSALDDNTADNDQAQAESSSSKVNTSSLSLDASAAGEILITLGAATFAALLSGCLLLFKAGLTVANLNAVAPLIALGGVPLLASGLLLWQRLTNPKLIQLRTAGTSLAIIGALASLASIGLAWPNPFSVALAALLCYVIFTFVAVRLSLPLAHAPAALCFAILYAVGFYAVLPITNAAAAAVTNVQAMDGATLVGALISITNGQRLVGLCVLLVFISEWLSWREATRGLERMPVNRSVINESAHWQVTASGCYAGTACLVATLSFYVVTTGGFNLPGDPHRIAFIYGLYAVGAFLLASRRQQRAQLLLAWVGSVLLLLALGQSIAARFSVNHGWQAAMLAHSSLMLLAATLINSLRSVKHKAAASTTAHTESGYRRFDSKAVDNILSVLNWSTLGSSVLAVVLLIGTSETASTSLLAGRVFWLAAVWLGVSLMRRSHTFVVLFQIAIVVGVTLTVTAHLEQAAWFTNTPTGWLQPWSLQAYGCALALLILTWTIVRHLARELAARQTQNASFEIEIKANNAWGFLRSSGEAVERSVIVLLVSGFVLLSIYAAVPGVVQELAAQAAQNTPTLADSQLSGAVLPHKQARGAGSWALLTLLLGVLLGNFFTRTSERSRRFALLGAILVAACACPLLAGRWENQLATATVWRWLAACLLVVGSILMLLRDARTNRLATAALPTIQMSQRLTTQARMLLCVVTLAPLLLFTFYAAADAIIIRPINNPVVVESFFRKLGHTASYLIPLLVATVALVGYAVRNRRYLYLASITINLGATWWWATSMMTSTSSFTELWIVNAAALALPAIGWLVFDRYVVPIAATPNGVLVRSNEADAAWPVLHHVAAIMSAAVVTGVTIFGLLHDLSAPSIAATTAANMPSALLSIFAVVSIGALMIACLWDRRARFAVPGMYVLGLTATAMFLDYSNLAPRQLGATGMLALASYSVVTSGVWRMRTQLNALGQRLRLERETPNHVSATSWLIGSNLLIVFSVVLLGAWVILTFTETSWRFLAAGAVLMQTLTLGLLVPTAEPATAAAATELSNQLTQPTHSSSARSASFLLHMMFSVFAVSAVLFGWASLAPTSFATSLTLLPPAVSSTQIVSGKLLNYLVMMMIVLLSTAALYGAASDKLLIRESVWTEAADALVPFTVALHLISLLLVIATEIVYRISFDRIDIHPVAITVVIATLVGLCLLSLLFAIVPARDPLDLSERGRTVYVYAAEIFLALLFVHIRLTMPWLFSGFFSRYWPLIVIAIAFLGVGASELLRRQNRNVLAEPLARTGILLPLLPVVGFWAVSSEVNYSGVLFLVGLLYGVLSIMRQSFVFAVLAALTGNGGLWYVLHHTSGYNFFAHPQLWLVPLAFSVLVASHLHRAQLSADGLRNVRYVTLMMIYVSSTADIFINGVAGSMWLPMMLAGLSVAGVFAGILLRVQAYLFLGTAFLVLAVLTMIWHASANFGWTWLWYIAGIALGVCIILLFALFEKKRGEMLRVVEQLRAWER